MLGSGSGSGVRLFAVVRVGLAEEGLEFVHGANQLRDVLALRGQLPGEVPDVPEGVMAQPLVREVLRVRM